jgi:hypothetical protein
MFKSILAGVILALGFSLLLNASNIVTSFTGPQIAQERKTKAMDEDYYLALIQEAAEGHTKLGNPSLIEHRDDSSVVRYLALIPGGIMRAFSADRTTVLFALDLLIIFLLPLLISLSLLRIFPNTTTNLSVTMLLIGIWGTGLLNNINPKMVLILPFIHLLVFFGVRKPTNQHFVIRGALIGLMLYAYPHYFLYFLALEGCDFVRRILKEPEKLQKHFESVGRIALTALVVITPYLLSAFFGETNTAADDLWYRIVSPTHLPSAPITQLLLLLTISLLIFSRSSLKKADRHFADLLLVTLIAGLIVLNQSVIHGLDLMFGAHYRLILKFMIWLTAFFLFTRFTNKRSPKTWILVTLAIISIAEQGIYLQNSHKERHAIASGLIEERLPEIFSWMNEREGEQVILAPSEIANLVPVFTHHYTAWNGYAQFQSVTDRELAERYVLQELVEPQDESLRDRSFPQVFSVHAGNRAARARTWCRIKSFFQKSIEECRVPVRNMIRQQDVLIELEAALANQTTRQKLELINKFNVDVIISKEPLHWRVTRMCPETETIGKYLVHSCL